MLPNHAMFDLSSYSPHLDVSHVFFLFKFQIFLYLSWITTMILPPTSLRKLKQSKRTSTDSHHLLCLPTSICHCIFCPPICYSCCQASFLYVTSWIHDILSSQGHCFSNYSSSLIHQYFPLYRISPISTYHNGLPPPLWNLSSFDY